MNTPDQIRQALDELPRRMSEQVALLSEAAAKREMSDLREKLHQIFELSEFLASIFGKPEVVALGERTSFREDSVLRDACIHLTGSSTGDVKLLDVGCGVGNVPYALLQGLALGALHRIHYAGVERNSELVNDLKTLHSEGRAIYKSDSDVRTFGNFGSFEVYQGDVLSLEDIPGAPFDLILCHNLIHEISPFRIPGLLEKLNRLLRSDATKGAMAVVDMEALPVEFAEAEAFPWSGEEFGELLQAAGFSGLAVSKHLKKVPVFSASLMRIDGVNTEAALNCVTRVVIKRLTQRIGDFRKLRASASRGNADMRRLVHVLVEIGFILDCLRSHDVAVRW